MKQSRRTFIKTALFASGIFFMGVKFSGNAATKAASAVSDAGKTIADYMKDRISAVYGSDKSMKLRSPIDNPQVQLLYKSYLDAPMSEKAEHLLHTTFTIRESKLAKLRVKRLYPYKRLADFENKYPFEL